MSKKYNGKPKSRAYEALVISAIQAVGIIMSTPADGANRGITMQIDFRTRSIVSYTIRVTRQES